MTSTSGTARLDQPPDDGSRNGRRPAQHAVERRREARRKSPVLTRTLTGLAAYASGVSETIRDAIDRALGAYSSLTELGEEVEDEWTYVDELSEAWRERLGEVAAERGHDPLSEEAGTAVDRAIAEVGLITDPHRAIDWLSTFPQVVLLATGERP